MSVVDVQEATRTVFCKRPGCERESLGAAKGPYAGLCDEHTEEARQRLSVLRSTEAADREPKPVRPAAELAEEGFERKARGLVAVGRQLVVAIRRYRPAKEQLDQAIEGWRSVCRALAGEEPSA